ncbi:MAG: 50S ribosomal protein L15 [Candidatus Brocadiia bacterium]
MDIKKVNELAPPRTHRKRVGCGLGSGHGKTSTRGHKGQKARTGGAKPAEYFEGGTMPHFRRLPKRGFSNYPHKTTYEPINLSSLKVFDANTVVTREMLVEAHIVRTNLPVKILGGGEIDRALTVHVAAFSETARAKIEKAGGKVEVTK